MRVLVKLVILTLFLFAPALVLAEDLQKGLQAYEMGDYETALAQCLPLAEAGDAGAQFCVGRMYGNGFGVGMDDAEALKWYGLAATEGHPEAQFNLGVMYANGWGVDMNDAEAAKLYRQAAENGWACAQRSLAYVISRGIGTEENRRDAYMWYYIAAELGDTASVSNRDELGEELSQEDVQAAKDQAQKWLDGFKGKALQAGRIE